ncbi:hypothetical protein D3C84_646700 [compost metagenome]
MVAGLVAELLVDTFEVVQADADHRDPTLQATGIHQNLVQLLLQLLTVRQAGEEVVLGHAQQAVFGLVAQVGIALDGLQQLVGGVDPEPQFVLLVALEQRNLVFAGTVGVDIGQVLDDPRQRLGQQPVIDQVQHQPHGHCPEHTGNEDDDGADNKPLAIGGGVKGDAQVTVILTVGTTAHQWGGEGALLAQNQVSQPATVGLLRFTALLREHGFVGVADGGHAHRVILEQAFDDLHTHFTVEAIHRLGRGVAKHVEDAVGIVGHRLTGFISIEDNLCAA